MLCCLLIKTVLLNNQKTLSQVNISALEFGNDFRKEVTTTAAVHVTGISGDISSGRLTIADTIYMLNFDIISKA